MTLRPSDSPSAAVGPALAQKLLDELGIDTVGELLRYTPMRYVRRGESSGGAAPEKGDWITLVGTVTRADERRMRQRSGTFLSVTVDDGIRTTSSPSSIPVSSNGSSAPACASWWPDRRVLPRPGPADHPDWLVLPDAGSPQLDAVGSPMLAAMAADATSKKGDAGVSADGVEIDPADFDRPVLPLYRATKACRRGRSGRRSSSSSTPSTGARTPSTGRSGRDAAWSPPPRRSAGSTPRDTGGHRRRLGASPVRRGTRDAARVGAAAVRRPRADRAGVRARRGWPRGPSPRATAVHAHRWPADGARGDPGRPVGGENR